MLAPGHTIFLVLLMGTFGVPFFTMGGIEESNQRLSLCAHVSRRKWHPYSEYFTLDWPVSVLLCLLALIQLTEANELQFSITLHF
jgi:hypothetical protein